MRVCRLSQVARELRTCSIAPASQAHVPECLLVHWVPRGNALQTLTTNPLPLDHGWMPIRDTADPTNRHRLLRYVLSMIILLV